jgi:quinol monooxygenase YgiN
MIIRIFDTAVHPDDVDRFKDLFQTQVKPAFATFEGCAGIEMYLGVEEHSGDLVDAAALSRWDSLESIQSALTSPAYDIALRELKELFRQAPIVRHFTRIDE